MCNRGHCPNGGRPPDIDVQGNGISIVSGDTTPSTADFTDFGSTDMDSGSISAPLTIKVPVRAVWI